MAIELYRTGDLTPGISRDIENFLDSQSTSHVLQFPQWTVPNSICVLLRDNGSIQWFGSFGLQVPLGSQFPSLRALIANRGPVCDDLRVWQAGMEEFVNVARQQNLIHIEVRPDWIETLTTIESR